MFYSDFEVKKLSSCLFDDFPIFRFPLYIFLLFHKSLYKCYTRNKAPRILDMLPPRTPLLFLLIERISMASMSSSKLVSFPKSIIPVRSSDLPRELFQKHPTTKLLQVPMVHTLDVPPEDNVSFWLPYDLNTFFFPKVEHDHACYIVNGRPISVGHRIPCVTDVMAVNHSIFLNCSFPRPHFSQNILKFHIIIINFIKLLDISFFCAIISLTTPLPATAISDGTKHYEESGGYQYE